MDIQRGTVEFTGLKELEALEQTIVKGISQEYLPVIQREIKNNFDLLVHVKANNRLPQSELQTGKIDKRVKYSIHLKLIYANNNSFNIDKVHDWDLNRALHESMVALLNRIKKEFKGDASRIAHRKSTQKSEKQIKRRELQVRKDKRKSAARRNAQNKRSK